MSQMNSAGAAKSGRVMAIAATGLSAFTVSLLLATPAHAQAREAFEIECPRTIVSPEAQIRIDTGEKPEIVKSPFKPGLVNPQGFCTITLSPNGERMFQIYNEATSVGQIPIRFEYQEHSLYAFAGEKGMPLGKGRADMVCDVPAKDEYTADCSISLTFDGTMFFRRKEGRGNEESSVSIAARDIFGIPIKAADAMTHYELSSSGSIYDANYRKFFKETQPDCSKPYWVNVARVITLSTGRRNGNAVELTRSFEMEDADPNLFVRDDETPQQFPRFEMKNGEAAAIIDSVMTSEAVQVDVETACEGKLSKAFLTELPRVMNHVYEAIKPRLLRER